jgi:Polyketide cyclase / dehydrase and lipid transport
MSVYGEQAHLDAPLDEVWALVSNPAAYPEWWPAVVEIRGQTFEVGDLYTQIVPFAGRWLAVRSLRACGLIPKQGFFLPG